MIRIRRTLLFAAGAGVAAVGTWVVVTSPWWRTGNVYDLLANVTLIIGFWSLFLGAVWLYRWRPASRMWKWVAACGVTWTLWASLATSDDTWAELLTPWGLNRPLI